MPAAREAPAREELWRRDKEPQGTGEPVTERARIAGVEAGVAAGLGAVDRGARRARSEPATPGRDCDRAVTRTRRAGPRRDAQLSTSLAAYDLPDWTDPPTLQVPRVLLDLEQEAAAERGGPPPPPPGGPVWRERQEDWDDTDAVLADLASAGPSVTAYEESSSDDPFAYDFLDLDDESSWIARRGTGPRPSAPPR